jgi:pyruvate formate lyase activating enzyme
MTVAEVMIDIERDVVFFDQSNGGVTFSGGEPLFQPDFLGSLLRACKEREIHTAVDTCGFVTWKTLESIRPFVDLFLYDLKLMDSAQHQRFTGVPNELILKNLEMLSRAGHNIILRIPIVPGINDDDENMRRIGSYVSDTLSLNRVDILPYHHTAAHKYERLMKGYELNETRPPTDGKMNHVVEILQGFGLQVRIGG